MCDCGRRLGDLIVWSSKFPGKNNSHSAKSLETEMELPQRQMKGTIKMKSTRLVVRHSLVRSLARSLSLRICSLRTARLVGALHCARFRAEGKEGHDLLINASISTSQAVPLGEAIGDRVGEVRWGGGEVEEDAL